jgi:hypothetical protein
MICIFADLPDEDIKRLDQRSVEQGKVACFDVA